jgi:translation elongation factor EF-Ts
LINECFFIPDPQTLKMNDGSPLPEVLSFAIGRLKEKIVVTRIQLCVAEEGVALHGYAHPRGRSIRFSGPETKTLNFWR